MRALLACLIVKSGSDFRNFTAVDVFISKDQGIDVRLTRFDVTAKSPIDPVMKSIVSSYMDLLQHSLDQKIGIVGVSVRMPK